LFLFNRFCQCVIVDASITHLIRWRVYCESRGERVASQLDEEFLSLQAKLATSLKVLLSGAVLAEDQSPVLHQVLEKVAECTDIHLQIISESIQYVISELPRSQRGANWGDLVTSYLSLDTWLSSKCTGIRVTTRARSKNAGGFQGVVVNSLSVDSSYLKALGAQSAYLRQKIPDEILHPVMNALEKCRSVIFISDLYVILQSFVTIPQSFGGWVIYNSNCMFTSSFLVSATFSRILQSHGFQCCSSTYNWTRCRDG
jgi:hypothetical protein